MKNLLLIVSLLSVTFVFAKNDSINPERITYEYFSSKSINIKNNEGSIYPEMVSGNKIVFQYSKQHAERPAISDDEMYESILFEVDSSWNKFVFKKKIAMSKATYQLGCFCIGRGYHIIDGGYIKGRKLTNGNYLIEADVFIKYESGVKKKIKFKGEFKAVNEG